jgi:hypothetical protein
LLTFTVLGPLVSFQDSEDILVPLAVLAVPTRKLEAAGDHMVCALPAFTTGTVLATVVAPLTVTETVEEADCPRLLVAVKVKT